MAERPPIATALRDALKGGYSLAVLRRDALAALVVSLVALPLAMALSIAVGLPPQNGLYTAIVAGLVVPLLGGSRWQVSGPTAAFVVIVAPIIAAHGLRGLILTTLMAGVLLIALGLGRVGRYIAYIPYPVTTGFTAGIAVVIGTLALNDFLGLHIAHLTGSYLDKIGAIALHVPSLNWPEALVGLVSLVVMFTSDRLIPKVPPPVAGIGAGTLLALGLQKAGLAVATLGSQYSHALPGGGVGRGIPPFPPSLHLPGLDPSALFALPTFGELKMLAVPALVIAALGALESLLSATVADGMAGTKHDPNAELVGIGIGNILSALAGGIPATGAIARTATNIHSGARTPLASAMHAVLIMLYVMLLAPVMSYIPMASLAALLITVAYRMSHWRQGLRIFSIGPRSDAAVLVACFGFTVFIDMVWGVGVGVVLACFLLVRNIAALTQTGISGGGNGTHAQMPALPGDVMVYHIDGSIFFATIEKAFDRMGFVHDGVRTLIIDMEKVPLIDMSGLVAMKGLILDLEAQHRKVILCGRQDVTGPILKKLPEAARADVRVTQTLADAAMLVA